MANFNVELNSNPVRNTNEYTLLLRITVDRKHARIKLNYAINKKHFNPSPKEYKYIRSSHSKHAVINSHIDLKIQEAKDAITYLENKHLTVTANSIKGQMLSPKSNKLTDDDIPIPIKHLCKPERLGKDMTGLELHQFGLSLFMTFLVVQDGKLIAVNMNPENGAPHVIVENPQKVLLYIWVKTDLAPNIPVYVLNDTHDVITEISRKHRAIPGFASITISCVSKEGKLIPKCGGEYYAVLNEFEEI